MIIVICPASHSNSSLSISAYYNNRLNQFLFLFHHFSVFYFFENKSYIGMFLKSLLSLLNTY